MVQIATKLTGTSLFVPPEYRRMLLYRCIVGFTCMGFAFYAMSQMVLADASALILTSPVMTFFFVRSSFLEFFLQGSAVELTLTLFNSRVVRVRSSCTRKLTL